MGCGIYRIYNKKTEKSYVGSSINLSKREYKHFWLLRNNSHDNIFLQNSFNKFGESEFNFEIVEYCEPFDLINRENHYINLFKSNISEFGYNLATVNEFRRNTYNNEVKINLSKYNLKKNSNFKLFYLQNILNNEIKTFDNLVDAANYLIENLFTSGNPRNIRQKISYCLRNKKVNNGKKYDGAKRKTCYKHKVQIIN
jgi:group I intron endonuclease